MMIQELHGLFLQHPTLCIDTRKISQNCLFFALKGPNFNANEFASKALEEGAAYAIVDQEQYVLSDKYILVEDVLTSLQDLARYHRQQLTIPVIAITGSNGKTTSKELCYQVLKQKYKTTATKGNLNNHIGVPLSLLSIPLDAEIALIEMGANHIGEIDFLCKIAQPDYGIITNIGKAHLEGFGSIEGVLQAKTELYKHLGTKGGTIFIKDNHQILLEQVPVNCKCITYGQLSKSSYKVLSKGAQPFMTVETENTEIASRLIGDYNFDNIALSIALGNYFNVSLEAIKLAIESYTPTNNRSQLIQTDANTLLLDAYNANPMSVEKAIANLSHIKHPNKVMILGDMFELGEDSEKEHINIINHCLSSGVPSVYLVGADFNNCNETAFPSYNTTQELVQELKKQPIKDAFVLIKGSRGMKLEQLADFL